jgi:predicted small lipoprotein YifL
MKRALVLVAVLSLAGCGGTHNTKKPGVKPSRCP